MKVLLDTNFLLLPGKFKFDVFSELENLGYQELYIFDSVLEELKKITGRDKNHAKLALEMIKKKRVSIIITGGKPVDRELERFALNFEFMIATQDRKLRNRIKKKGGRVCYLRQRKYMVFE